MHGEEVASGSVDNGILDRIARLFLGRDGYGDDGGASTGKLSGNKRETLQVLRTFLFRRGECCISH